MSKSNPNVTQPRGALNNAAWNAFATCFNIIITFLLAPLLIHYLGEDQWGLLLLVWSVTGVLGMANFGVGEATLRFIAHYHADGNLNGVNRVLGATLTFYTCICTVVSGALFGATSVVAQWVKMPADSQYPVDWLLRLAAVLFTFGMIANAYRSIPMAMQRYDISSRIGLGQSLVRSLGVIVLVVAGLNVIHVVIWEVIIALAMLVVNILVARKLMPGMRWLPNLSFAGFREILGYSVFSFLTHIFLTIYRESGKLILGNRLGPASVAYLGTPDSIAHRLHSVVVSGIETLMPRFSAIRDLKSTRTLLSTATWAAMASGVVLYVPLAVLMADFLRLWINPEFARESARVGQWLVLSFIAPSAFAPIATLYRGIGKPSFVTLIMAAAGVVVLVSTLALVSTLGPMAVAYGYVISAVAWFAGIAGGWLQLYGGRSVGQLLRVTILPLVLGCGLGLAQLTIRSWCGELGWVGMLGLGGMFAVANGMLLLAVDRMLGSESPAEHFFGRVLQSERIVALRQRAGVWFGLAPSSPKNGG